MLRANLVILVWCFASTLAPFVVCFAVFVLWRNLNLAGFGVVGFSGLCFLSVSRFAACIMEPK